MVEEGSDAPDFELASDTGEHIRLSSLRGETVVLYFYPKDDTPGCTTQACGIRDSWNAFEGHAVVLGVSPDDGESHAQFRSKYALPFPLLADPDHRVAEAYDVWVEKHRDGEAYMGIERSTFVIDPRGVLIKVMRNVDPRTHAEEVLSALSA